MAAAHIEETIEKELLDRLSAGVYEDIYNFNPKAFEKVMDDKEVYEEEEELDEEAVENDNISDAELVYDSNEDDEDDEDDNEESDDNDDDEEEEVDEDETPPSSKSYKTDS